MKFIMGKVLCYKKIVISKKPEFYKKDNEEATYLSLYIFEPLHVFHFNDTPI